MGQSMTGTNAQRHNAGKLRWSLVDFESMEDMLRVLEFGAGKYSPDNWKLGLNKDELLESAIRHLMALMRGEEMDKESGLPHNGHVMCNMMFYSFYSRNNKFAAERRNPFKK